MAGALVSRAFSAFTGRHAPAFAVLGDAEELPGGGGLVPKAMRLMRWPQWAQTSGSTW